MVIYTEKGPEFGWIDREPKNLIWSQPDDGLLYTVVQVATSGDLGRHQQNKEGEELSTPHGLARVIVGHGIEETVSVRYPDDRVLEWPLAQLSRLSSTRN